MEAVRSGCSCAAAGSAQSTTIETLAAEARSFIPTCFPRKANRPTPWRRTQCRGAGEKGRQVSRNRAPLQRPTRLEGHRLPAVAIGHRF
jgi:hypothetical protein